MGFFSNLFQSKPPVPKPTQASQASTSPKTISSQGLDLIISYEGIERRGGQRKYAPKGTNFANEDQSKFYVYADPVGLLTIGIGHLLTQSEISSGNITINGKRVNYKKGITRKEVMDLKTQDAQRFINALNAVIKVPVTQTMFDAMASLAFNIGSGAFSRSTLLRKLNARDYQGAANEFLKWNKSKGKVLSGLTRRRTAERQLFLKDINKV